MRLGAILALAALLWLPAATALDRGDAAPALHVVTLDGKPFDLSALRGKVVVFNLWATWCPPCRDEMPQLDAFYRKFASRGVVVFGLSEDSIDQTDEVRETMKPFIYPAALAQGAQDNGFRTPRVLPITYIIDTEGVIRAKLWPGGTPVTEANLEQAVEPLLSAPAKP